MATPLLEQRVPPVGDSYGCPQLVVGPAVGRHSGVPAFLLSVNDRRTQRHMLALFVELPSAAVGHLVASGHPAPPIWPLLVASGPQQVAWDGLTSIGGASAVHVDDATISWVEDPAGAHVCVTPARQPGTPDQLLGALRATGVVAGWARENDHERAWLLDNVARVAPGISPPADADVAELRAGLAVLAGFATSAAMVATGGYRPQPQVNAASITLSRVRTTWRPELLRTGRASIRVGPHRTGPGSLPDVLAAGRITTVRTARLVGQIQATWTAHSALACGMGHLIDLEVDPDHVTLMPPPAFVWDSPDRLLNRLDAAAVATRPPPPTSGSQIGGTTVTDPTGRVLDTDVDYPSLLLETCVELYGPYGPDRIIVRDQHERQDAVATLRKRNIESLQSRWVEDAVQIHPALISSAQAPPALPLSDNVSAP